MLIPLLQKVEIDRHASVSVLLAQPEAPRAFFILAHGAAGCIDNEFMQFYLNSLYENGIAVATFNFPFAEAGRKAPDQIEKLDITFSKVITFLRQFQILDNLPMFIGGKSMGARAAARISRDLPNLNGLVFLAYPFHPAGRPNLLKMELLSSISHPALFIQGERDMLATKDPVKKAVRQMRCSPTVIWLQGADHAFVVSPTLAEEFNNPLELSIKSMVAWIDKIILTIPKKVPRRRRKKA